MRRLRSWWIRWRGWWLLVAAATAAAVLSALGKAYPGTAAAIAIAVGGIVAIEVPADPMSPSMTPPLAAEQRRGNSLRSSIQLF
jgi:hypothetical protein